MIHTVKDYEKLSEQYNKMLEERNSLIDDLSWYKAKVSRLEQIREIKDSALKGVDIKVKTLEQRHSKLVDENTRLQNELYTLGLNQDEADDKVKEYKTILSEISQHIGNKPSSSTYKYFRAKLDNIGTKEGVNDER